MTHGNTKHVIGALVRNELNACTINLQFLRNRSVWDVSYPCHLRNPIQRRCQVKLKIIHDIDRLTPQWKDIENHGARLWHCLGP